MAFVPTEKQVESLHFLLKQLVRENIEIRLIRFIKWSEKNIKDHIVEVLCFEDEDCYVIFYSGIIDKKISI